MEYYQTQPNNYVSCIKTNSADLAGFRNQLVLELFVSGPGNVMGAYAWSSNRHK